MIDGKFLKFYEEFYNVVLLHVNIYPDRAQTVVLNKASFELLVACPWDLIVNGMESKG